MTTGDMMTNEQRELARHALGLPNKTRTTCRNHFCTGIGSGDYGHWDSMAAKGLAVKITGPHWGGDDMFFLTMKGVKEALDSNEYISQEEVDDMRRRVGVNKPCQ